MTPEEYESAQHQFVTQAADRLGLEPADKEVLLDSIQGRDAEAFKILGTFRAAYCKWFNTSAKLQQAVEVRGDVDGLRHVLIQMIAERNRTRRELVSFLDTNYPRGENLRYDGDIVAASGIPV